MWIIIDFRDWDMEGDEALLLIGSLNYDFGGSRTKTEKKSSKTSISDWDTNVQGPGFEQVLDTFWGHFWKTLRKRHDPTKCCQRGADGDRSASLVWRGGELT